MTLDIALVGQTLTVAAPPLAGGTLKKLYCSVTADSEWDGLTLTLIFRSVTAAGTVSRSAIVEDKSSVEVPHEVIRAGYLYISAVGVAQEGTVRMTTIEMPKPLELHVEGLDDADPEGSITATVAEAILAAIGTVSNLDTTDKSSLVAAVNEVLGKAAGAVKSINNVLPNANGALALSAGDILAQVAGLDNYSGDVNGALEALAELIAGKTRLLGCSNAVPAVRDATDTGQYNILPFTPAVGDYVLGANGYLAKVTALTDDNGQIEAVTLTGTGVCLSAVQSINGQAGKVVLGAADVGAVPVGAAQFVDLSDAYEAAKADNAALAPLDYLLDRDEDGSYYLAYGGDNVLYLRQLTTCGDKQQIVLMGGDERWPYLHVYVNGERLGWMSVRDDGVYLNDIRLALASELPPAPTAEDAGKVLTVADDGTAVWTAVDNAEEVAV